MKKFYFVTLLLLAFSTVHAWSEFGADEYNTFSSDYTGEKVLVEKFSYNIGGTATISPLIYNNLIFVFSDRVTVLNSEGGIEWVYNSGSVEATPVIVNNSIIIAGDELTSLSLSNGLFEWSSNQTLDFTSELIDYEGNIIGILDDKVMSFYSSNGSIKWSINLSNCKNGGVLVDNELFLSCDEILYTINAVNGGVVNSYNLGSEIKSSLLYYNDLIFFSADRDVYAFTKSLTQVDRLPFFYPNAGVETNLALGSDEFFACASNGLYSIIVENNRLYYNNFHAYSDCNSLIAFDYDNNNIKDVLFKQEDDLLILNSSGAELLKEENFNNELYAIGEVDEDGKAELVTVSSNAFLTVYDMTSPDNIISLWIDKLGFYANITNNGFEDSVCANLTLTTPISVESILVNVSSGESITQRFSYTPSSEEIMSLNASVVDVKDVNSSNNFDSLYFEVVNATGDSLGVIYHDYYYDFNDEIKSEVILVDVNGDGIEEEVIKDLALILDETGFIPLGDLSLSVNHFLDEFYANQVLEVNGFVTNNASYPVKNVDLKLLVDDVVMNSTSFNLTSAGNYTFNYNLSGFNVGEGRVFVKIDTNNKIYEINEGNNAYGKSVLIAPIPVHELNLIIDTSTTTLHNNILRLRVNNSGDFNEELTVYSNPSYFQELTLQSSKKNIEWVDVILNLSVGGNAFEIFMENDYFYFNELIELDLDCELDSDCGEGYTCNSGSCEELDELLTTSYQEEINEVITEEFEGNESNHVNNQVGVTHNNLSGMITGSREDSGNPIFYWVAFTLLLIISSFSVYVLSFKLFEDKAHIIALVNLIFFLGIAYVFQPVNIHNVLILEIFASLFGFFFARRF